MNRMIDADAIIKELRADIDVYRGRGDSLYVDGVIHGLNVAINEVREAAEAAGVEKGASDGPVYVQR